MFNPLLSFYSYWFDLKLPAQPLRKSRELPNKISITNRLKALFFSFFLFYFAPADGLESLSKEVYINSDSKQLAQQTALNEFSRELVLQMIGQKKYEKERRKVEKAIIQNQNRYILSTRSSPPVLQEDGKFLSMVTIQFSKENLKNLLLEHHLFYAEKSSFCVLPLLSFALSFDGKKEIWSWQKKNREGQSPVPVLKNMTKSFFELLSRELIKTGFFPLDPVFQKMAEGAPSAVWPKKSSRARDFIPLAHFFRCDIILFGSVQAGDIGNNLSFLGEWFSTFKEKKEKPPSSSSSYFTRFSFHVFNIKNRRTLFKLKKQFPFPSSMKKTPAKEVLSRFRDVLDSLLYQLSSYQTEGSLDRNRLIISVQGPLSYAEKEKLKKALIKSTPGIQSLEERLLTSNRVVYEAGSSQSIKQVAKQLKALSVPGFVIQLKGYKKQELEIYAKKQAR